MQYSDRQIAEILQKIIAKARRELQIAREKETVNDVMERYGVTLEFEAIPVHNRSKILVFGALPGKISSYQAVVKDMGIPLECVEFESDYDKLTHYNTANLRDSLTYSDIIFGPHPHKEKGMGDVSSINAAIEKEPNRYPRVQNAGKSGELRFSVSNFKICLANTRYYESVVLG